jgi:hypothetical protein
LDGCFGLQQGGKGLGQLGSFNRSVFANEELCEEPLVDLRRRLLGSGVGRLAVGNAQSPNIDILRVLLKRQTSVYSLRLLATLETCRSQVVPPVMPAMAPPVSGEMTMSAAIDKTMIAIGHRRMRARRVRSSSSNTYPSSPPGGRGVLAAHIVT